MSNDKSSQLDNITREQIPPDEPLRHEDIQQLLLATAPITPDATTSEKMKKIILNRAEKNQGAPRTSNPEKWQQLTRTIEIKVLWQDTVRGLQSAIWRCRPGARIPSHIHEVDEELLLIEGSLQCGDIIMTAGDYTFMPAGSTHKECFSEQGCLLFLRGAISNFPQSTAPY